MKTVLTVLAVVGLIGAAVAAKASSGGGVDSETARLSVSGLLPLGMAIAIFMTRKS